MDLNKFNQAKKEAPQIKVKCGVENCSYNFGSMCHANELEVNAIGNNKAKTSDGTSCTTFINKDSNRDES